MGSLYAGDGLTKYEDFVKSKLSKDSGATEFSKLMTAAMGCCGESGELMDHIKKYMYHGPGHDLDDKYIDLELGDLLFYVTVGALRNGQTLQDIADKNVAKLNARYKEAFTSAESANRTEGRPESAHQPLPVEPTSEFCVVDQLCLLRNGHNGPCYRSGNRTISVEPETTGIHAFHPKPGSCFATNPKGHAICSLRPSHLQPHEGVVYDGLTNNIERWIS